MAQNDYFIKKIIKYQITMTNKEIETSEIIKLIPHRHPFLFIDRVIPLEEGKSCIGIKNLTFNENFFQGHFPGNPVMPGVLVIEAMAQTASVLVSKSMNTSNQILEYYSQE